ncbi:MAG: phenylalanine--tRNA ligase subunit beta [Thermoprotei archaeon]|nr:MAG: phenylalanine--tRNA ligase subunit beta [Thermoprotei archaeon]RLF02508.1 MAG: phenylalanine--tRNA ligase subunit beta [Thermoprotei archaeon]
MPVIQVNWRDLEKLVGKSLSEEEISQYLPALKCEIEGIVGDEIEYEATHDRPDLFSAEGLARALKGLLELEVGLRKFNVKGISTELPARGPAYRPYVLGAIVRGLDLDEEALKQIMNLQEKLHTTYCRDRRKVSIGLYDLSTVKFPIKYIAVKPEEISFVPLGETEPMTLNEILSRTEKGRMYAHLVRGHDKYPLLIDSEGTVLSFPPIINSEDTKVTENTREVFIDVTGVDLNAVMNVLKVIVTSVAERGKPEVIELVKVTFEDGREVVSPDLSAQEMLFDPNLVERLVGIKLGIDDIRSLLRRMRHEAEPVNDVLKVQVAPYRLDILHQVDLAEDVAMAYGYENIGPEPIPTSHPGSVHPIEKISRKLRDILIGLGFFEVSNYMMSNPDVLVTRMRLKEQRVIEVENPKMEKYTAVRNWLIPGLLETASLNLKLGYPLKLFEIGDVVIVDEREENKTRTERHLACLIISPEETLTNILVVIKAIMKALNVAYTLRESEHPSFIPGRTASIIVDNNSIGILGEIHPEVLMAFEINLPTVCLEINVNDLLRIISY